MRPIARGLAVALTSIALAACGGSGTATNAPASQSTATKAPPASQAAAVCAPSDATGTVNAEISGSTFVPEEIDIKVGDVVTWSNKDGVTHGVELDDPQTKCTASIGGGSSKSGVFNVAGTYPFHCFIHRSMVGTIKVS